MLKAYHLNQVDSKECLSQSASNGRKPLDIPATFPAWCFLFCPCSPWPPWCSQHHQRPLSQGLCMGPHPLADCTYLELRIACRSWWLQCGLSSHLTIFPLPWTAGCPGSIYQEQVPTLHSICTLIYLFTQCVYWSVTVEALSLSLCWYFLGIYHSPWEALDN